MEKLALSNNDNNAIHDLIAIFATASTYNWQSGKLRHYAEDNDTRLTFKLHIDTRTHIVGRSHSNSHKVGIHKMV